MPVAGINEKHKDYSSVYARFRREYIAKGCNARKAYELAFKKVQRQQRKGVI